MDRRDFLKLLSSASLAGAVTGGTGCDDGTTPAQATDPTAPPAHGRKNLLLLLCDDLNDYINGLGGHPQAYTPNIDRLRALGVTFSNAHANVPLCAPSRPSMLSGLLPSSTGHYHGTPRYFRDRPSLKTATLLTQHLDDAGYDVYITGKVAHEDAEVGQLFSAGSTWDRGTRLGYMTSYGPYVWDGSNSSPEKINNPEFPAGIQSMHFGFGRLSKPPRHGNGVAKWFYGNPSYMGTDGINGGEFHYAGELDRSPVPDELNTDWIINLLKGIPAQSYSGKGAPLRAKPLDPARPFAIFCGLTSTHLPLNIPDACFDDILSHNGITSADDIVLPELLPGDLARLYGDAAGAASLEKDLSDIPTLLKTMNGVGTELFQKMFDAGQSWPGGPVRLFKEYIHAYLAAVRMIDLQVGKLLDALAESGHLNDTLVVFTSDNGYSRLEKNWNYKYNLWSESTRVPLVVLDPSLGEFKGSVVDAPASLIDILPTVIDACALPPVAASDTQLPLDGQSLLALAGNDARAVTPALSMVKAWPMPLADAVIHPDFAAVTAVTRHWRYTQSQRYRGAVAEELYNLRTDPNEWHNLAAEPALLDIKRHLDKALADRMVCGGLRRTRLYAEDAPEGFDPDALA
jgi:arylsulfatase A-like enzyme